MTTSTRDPGRAGHLPTRGCAGCTGGPRAVRKTGRRREGSTARRERCMTDEGGHRHSGTVFILIHSKKSKWILVQRRPWKQQLTWGGVEPGLLTVK